MSNLISIDLSRWVCTVTVCLSISCLRPSVAAETQQSKGVSQESLQLKQAIADEWKKRISNVHSLCCTWQDEVTYVKGSLGKSDRLTAPDIPNGTPIPDREVTLKASGSLKLRGDGAIFTEKGLQWSRALNKSIDQDLTIVCHNGEDRQLFLRGAFPFPVGSREKDQSLKEVLKMDACFPLVLSFRILDPNFTAFQTKEMNVVELNNPDKRDDIVSVVLPQTFGRVQLWLDKSKALSAVRCVFIGSNESVMSELRISYEKSENNWYPKTWTRSVFDASGQLMISRAVTVTELSINCMVPDKDLDLQFPAGTWLNDLTDRVSYVILPDGTHREVRPGESVRDYDRLLKNHSQSVFPRRTIGIAVTVIVICILLFLKVISIRKTWDTRTYKSR